MVHSVCDWIGNTFRVAVSHVEESISKIGGELLGRMQSDAIPDLVNNTMRYVKKLASGGAFLII